MTKPPIPALLTAILCLAAAFALWQSTRYFFAMRRLQMVQGELASIDMLQVAVRNLTTDCVEYSQVNTALEPVLQQFQVRGSRPLPPNPAPAAKPSVPAPNRPASR